MMTAINFSNSVLSKNRARLCSGSHASMLNVSIMWRHVSDLLQVLQELVMDILRVISASDLEVRKKTLSLVLDLVSSRNIEEVRCHL